MKTATTSLCYAGCLAFVLPGIQRPILVMDYLRISPKHMMIIVSALVLMFGEFVGPVQLALLVVTALICVVSGISILVSIYNSMNERTSEIAVMRALEHVAVPSWGSSWQRL